MKKVYSVIPAAPFPLTAGAASADEVTGKIASINVATGVIALTNGMRMDLDGGCPSRISARAMR